jgi:membrane fusion protein (multidrug efflux system)
MTDDLPREISDGDVDAGSAEIRDQEVARIGAKTNRAGRPAPHRRRRITFDEQAVVDKLDDAIQANRSAEAAVQTAKAAVDKAQLDVGFADIRSPIAGVAGVANAQIGDLVGPTDPKPLTSVSQLDPIRVSFPLAEREYIRFQQQINAVAAGGELPEGTGLDTSSRTERNTRSRATSSPRIARSTP